MFCKSAKSLAGLGTLSIAMLTIASSASIGRAQEQVANQSKGVPAELASYGASYPGTGSGDYYSSYNTPKPIGYGPMWPATGNRDCGRFNHYPYVYYPQNFQSSDYFRSSNSMYYRYPPEMQIPVYNKHWHNYYPNPRRYHSGHHFLTDVF